MSEYEGDIVIFDCDSTLTAIEGIDELARRAGVYEQLAPLTTAAMEGKIRLDDIYKKRLDLIRPSRSDIEWLAQCYLDAMVPDARTVIAALQQAGKSVHIVSGGLLPAVMAVARYLHISENNVHAVDVCFNADGSYADYEQASPLAKSGGKKTVCRNIIGEHATAVLIGDGITDLEAAQDRVCFIGFGGIVQRPAVQKTAETYLTERSLEPLLQYLL